MTGPLALIFCAVLVIGAAAEGKNLKDMEAEGPPSFDLGKFEC
jgi:hypothetical protein